MIARAKPIVTKFNIFFLIIPGLILTFGKVTAQAQTEFQSLFAHYSQTNQDLDQNEDDKINNVDFSYLLGAPTVTPTPTVTPEPSQTLRGVRTQASSCSDQDEINELLDTLEHAKVNTIYYSVFWLKAYYHSNIMPHHSFDSLAYLVPQAHARGIEVFALITAGKLGWREHSEWNARLNSPEIEDDWLDFRIPAARQFVADVAVEVEQYGIDGILLDYIRWAPAWSNFDCEENAGVITQTVEMVNNSVSIPVTASVFRNRAHSTNAGQLWYNWLNEGIVDYVTPMLYTWRTNNPDGHPDQVSEILAEIAEWNASGLFPDRIIPRLSTWFFRPDPDQAKTVNQVLLEIETCYNAGATSMTLWDDRELSRNPNLVEALRNDGW